MKKLLTILCVLTLLCFSPFFTGCGTKNNSNEKSKVTRIPSGREIGSPSAVRPINSPNRHYNNIISVSDGWVAVGQLNGFPLDAVIARYDNQGNIIWEKAFGGSDLDAFYSVIEVFDGYIVSADSNSTDGSLFDAGNGRGMPITITVKYDENGTLLWIKDLNSAVAIANDSGFLAVGGEKTPVSANNSVYITQFDTNGNVLWNKPIGDSLELHTEHNNRLYISKILDGPDGYFLFGSMYHIFEPMGDGASGPNFVVSVTADGIVRWQKTFSDTYPPYGGMYPPIFINDIITTNDGIVVVGKKFDGEQRGAFVEKFDFEMNSVWKAFHQTPYVSLGVILKVGEDIFGIGGYYDYDNYKIIPFIFGIDTNGEIFRDTGLQDKEGMDYTYYGNIFIVDKGFAVYQYAYNNGLGSIDNSFLFFNAR
jgi:hypothetical protein